MAINLIQGLPGSGKSYTVVNRMIVDVLRNGKRRVFTNLPVKVDEFMAVHGPRGAEGQRSWRERLVILEDGQEGEKEDGETYDALREFWWGMERGAVAFLDEVGEYYNARDWKNAPPQLGSYINRHRHFGHDLYFVCQKTDDIDAQLRRKIQYVWTCRNLRGEPFVERWPFSIVEFPCNYFVADKQVLALDAGGTRQKKLSTISSLPKRRWYDTYESSSNEGASLAGMNTEGGSIQDGSDFAGARKRWSAFAVQLAIAGGSATLAGFVIFKIGGRLIDPDTWTGKKNDGEQIARVVNEDRPGEVFEDSGDDSGLQEIGGEQGVGPSDSEPVVRAVLYAPGRFLASDGVWRVPGDAWDGGEVIRVGRGFVTVRDSDGRSVREVSR